MTPSPVPASWDIVVACNRMLPMRDGVCLATDVYRPAQDGEPIHATVPTILCRTPYNKSDARYVEIAEFFTLRGYVTVLQDLRGRGKSEGVGQYFHVANEDDGRDGYDTVEWIASQPWSNGRVGTVGSSFAALVQTRMAFERPPHLTAIWPDVTPTNSYHHQAREGGAMQLHMFWALLIHAQDALEIRDDVEAQQAIWDGLRDLRQLLEQTPWRRGETPLAKVPNLEQTLFDYYHRGAYDDFWQRECNDFERNFHRHADIPATFTGGWYDPYSAAMTAYYTAMSRQNQSPQRLIMGPWTHVAMRGDASWVGDVDFGDDSVWGVSHYFDEQARFFDRWLMPSDAPPPASEAPVQIFVMGGGDGGHTELGKVRHGGRWRDEWEWPLSRAVTTAYYLHADGSLSETMPATGEASIGFTFDPERPVPTVGGSFCGLMELPPDAGALDPMWARFIPPVTRLRHIVPTGPMHQQVGLDTYGAQGPDGPIADRPDVLVFQTTPLAKDIEVTGSVTVQLWVSSSAVDTDFTVKLLDIYPPSDAYPQGFAMNLVDSIIRTRYRNSWQHEEMMVPGTVYPITIQLPPTSNLFAAGHRIRLDISSSNFPRFDVNPNTGEPVGQHEHMRVAQNTVHLHADCPSQVRLPIIP